MILQKYTIKIQGKLIAEGYGDKDTVSIAAAYYVSTTTSGQIEISFDDINVEEMQPPKLH